jgi:hypothetical protein
MGTGQAKLKETSGSEVKIPSGPGGLMIFGGFTLAATGLAMVFLPRFVAEAAWYVTKLDRLGVDPGPVVAGGVALFAMGLVARSVRRLTHVAVNGQTSDAGLMFEHLASELADMRAEMRDTNLRMGQVRDEAHGLLEAVQARETIQAPQPAQDGGGRDAIFRLAASLDQLHAKIDKRLEAQAHAVSERIDKAIAEIGRTLATLQQKQASASAPVRQQPSAPTAAARPAQAQVQVQAPVQANEGRLELLDQLDDDVPPDQRTSVREQPITHGAIPMAQDLSGEPRAPLPSHGTTHTIPLGSVRPGGGDPAADARAREALERMQAG